MQNREPPAYLEYPASLLASRHFKLMSATERGAFISMKLECWVNKSLPRDPHELAVVLGLKPDEVTAALPKVMPFFALAGDEILCPELENYRAHLADRHLKQSAGGKRGAKKTNSNAGKKSSGETLPKQVAAVESTTSATTPAATSEATPAASGRVLSTTQPSTSKSNPSPVKGLTSPDSWIRNYEAASVDSAEAYRRASRGE